MVLRAEFVDLQEPIFATMESISQGFTVNGMETYSPPIQTLPWDQITDKPDTFPPSDHTHLMSEIIGLIQALAEKVNSAALAQVAFTGEMSDLISTVPTVLYCGTSTEVINC